MIDEDGAGAGWALVFLLLCWHYAIAGVERGVGRGWGEAAEVEVSVIGPCVGVCCRSKVDG